MQKRKLFSVFTPGMIIFLLLVSVVFNACSKEDEVKDALDKDTSYAFGMLIASEIGLRDLSFDYQALMEGFRDYNEDKDTRITQERAIEIITQVFAQLQSKHEEELWMEGEKNREEGEAYLASNAQQSGVITTASGLQYNVLTQGDGAKPGPDDYVRVHYEGSFLNGNVFDSSFMRGEPAEFGLDMVIEGWSEGLQLMNEGSVFRFVIPYDLAYGPNGWQGMIPPFSTLIFTVELVSVIE